MVVEVTGEAAPTAEQPVTAAAEAEVKCEKDESKPKIIEKSSSYREESNFLSDLEHEKKALIEVKTKLEYDIPKNTLFNKLEEEGFEKKNKSNDVGKSEKIPNSGCAGTLEPDGKQPDSELVEIDRDISIYGAPHLPSKGDAKIDVVLLKFLRAREFKTNDAFEMSGPSKKEVRAAVDKVVVLLQDSCPEFVAKNVIFLVN